MYTIGLWLNVFLVFIIIGFLIDALYRIKRSFRGKNHMLMNERFMGIHITAFSLLAITRAFTLVIYYKAGKYVSFCYMIEFALDFITGAILASILYHFSDPSFRQII